MAGTSIIPTNIALPAHIQARMGQASSLGAAVVGGISSGVSIPRVSLKGSRFRIIEDGTEFVLQDQFLDVVIVGANPHVSKVWYKNKWKPGDEPASPDCSSSNGVAPDSDAKDPQADRCASCPQNVWGSAQADNGQKLKACADMKRLAIVAANDPEGTIYLLNVTPAALKGLNQYHKELSARGIPAEVVITRLSFDTDASFPKLKFGFAGFIDADTQTKVDALFGSDSVREVTGEDSTPMQTVEATAKPVLVRETKPVEVEVEVIKPEEAPAKTKGFGKPAKEPEPAAETAPAKKGFGKSAKEPEPVAAVKSSSLTDDVQNLLNSMDESDD